MTDKNDNKAEDLQENNEEKVLDQPEEKVDESQEPTLEDQLKDMKEQWVRAVAESDNLRKRFEKEKTDLIRYGAINFIRDILPVADNLQRALEALPQDREALDDNFKNMIIGLEMVEKEIQKAFESHKIEILNPEKEPFDPNLHQAMFEVEVSDDVPAGHVASIMQKGYKLHDRLIRPALVGVAKKK